MSHSLKILFLFAITVALGACSYVSTYGSQEGVASAIDDKGEEETPPQQNTTGSNPTSTGPTCTNL